MLVRCPDCGKEISDQATACIHCGRPLTRGLKEQDIQPIEQTGKRFKLQIIIATCMVLVGMVTCIGGAASSSAESPSRATSIGAWLFAIGFIWFIVVRISAWWHHG